MISEKERQGWTVFEPTECVCIDVKIATIPTQGGSQSIFVFDLVVEDTGRSLVKYYNVIKSPKGNCTVKHNGDFAKLYRLATGCNPIARYSRAHQLRKDLIGIKFIAEYGIAYSSLDKQYFKATSLKPLVPIVTDDWFLTGVLKPKIKRRKQKPAINNSVDNYQQIRNKPAKEQQKIGNELVIGEAENPHSNLVPNRISIPLQDLASDIKPSQHPVTANNDLIKRKGEHKSFYYQQQDEETEAEYYYRVIDESRLLD